MLTDCKAVVTSQSTELCQTHADTVMGREVAKERTALYHAVTMSQGSESYSVANTSWGAAQCRTCRMQWEAVAEVSEASKVIVWV